MKSYFKFGFCLVVFAAGHMVWQYTDPTMPALKLPTITAWQMQEQIDYERALADAKKVLDGHGCRPEVPALAAKASLINGLPVKVVAADIVVESDCNSHAVSKAGAKGLMQVNEKIWPTDRNLFNPAENINMGAKILAWQARRYGIRGGLKRYFGISPDSNASDVYAAKVLKIAEGD